MRPAAYDLRPVSNSLGRPHYASTVAHEEWSGDIGRDAVRLASAWVHLDLLEAAIGVEPEFPGSSRRMERAPLETVH
jgi:hypothetical protein